ncbi:MAG TPA: DEAD/DEAH box helicase [Candidatus Nanoarchaeia archaeon]|nr:DEAD/DEAH box helicase [Candidatus Nanoarchaeia archaeon]
MKFEEFGLKPALLEQVKEQGFTEATKIQEKAIPEIKKGRDVVGQSETGSGKTFAFSLPILENIASGKGIQALVLTPTRELCAQVKEAFELFGKRMRIHTTAIFGGVGINPQFSELKRAEIVVATPGRLVDHLERGSVNFSKLNFLVLDEVDKMFEMGFIDDVEKIIKNVPKKRQTLLFSATISEGIHYLINKHLTNPLILKTKSLVDKKLLNQVYYGVEEHQKFSLLVHLLKQKSAGFSLIFCAMRHHTDSLAYNLQQKGVHALAIHGGLSQNRREYALDALKKQNIKVLVATDIAARGLDIKNVTHVYNYDVPKTADDYVHRIGRTARAGKNGEAITLLANRDHDNFRRVLMNRELEIVNTELPEFEKLSYFPNRRREGFGGRDSRNEGGSRGGFRRGSSGPGRGFQGRREHDDRRGYGSEMRDGRSGGRTEHRDSRRGFDKNRWNM